MIWNSLNNFKKYPDRHRLNESQYNQRLREVDELTKRTAELRDQLTRSEIACSHATDELSIANGRLEQMRNDSANLRAEKKIWEVCSTCLC